MAWKWKQEHACVLCDSTVFQRYSVKRCETENKPTRLRPAGWLLWRAHVLVSVLLGHAHTRKMLCFSWPGRASIFLSGSPLLVVIIIGLPRAGPLAQCSASKYTDFPVNIRNSNTIYGQKSKNTEEKRAREGVASITTSWGFKRATEKLRKIRKFVLLLLLLLYTPNTGAEW